MDPVTLGVAASIVTIIAFVYMLIFGGRGLIDWWNARRRAARPGPSPGPASDAGVAPAGDSAVAAALPPSADGTLDEATPSQGEPTMPRAAPQPAEPAPPLDKVTEEHIRSIAHDVERGVCVFLLGAGVSIEAGMPGGAELARMLAKKLGREYQGQPLPDLAQQYATLRGNPSYDVDEIIRRRRAGASVGLTDAHRALVCMSRRVNHIFTTNWDDLLESAFDLARRMRKCQRLYREADVGARDPGRTTIVKLHGHMGDPNSYILTRQHYQQYRREHPNLANYLRARLSEATVVVVGYSQEDTDFQEIYDDFLQATPPEHRPRVYVVNTREDAAWEQYWRDRSHERFIRLQASGFFRILHSYVQPMANREEELNVGYLAAPSQARVIEYCGLPGVGKSVVLQALRKEYDRRDAVTAYVDFADPERAEDSEGCRREIWRGIMGDLGIEARPLADALVEPLRGRGQIALFFDATDQAPSRTLRWLRGIFAPLVEQLPNLQLFVAGRSPRLHGDWPVSIHPKMVTRRLAPFAEAADTQQLMEYGFFFDEELSETVHRLTMGHPGLAQQVMGWLRENGIANHDELARPDRTAALAQFIAGLIDNCLFAGIGANLRLLIGGLAYYRGFSWEQVRRLRKDLSVPQCANLVRQRLWPTGLLTDGVPPFFYAVDPTVRALLLNIALVQDTQVFIDANRDIGHEYHSQVKDSPENRHLYVVERLYHLALELLGRQRLTGRSWSRASILVETVQELLQLIVDWRQLSGLQLALERDPDLPSLAEQLEPGLYDKVQQVVQERTQGEKP